MTPLPAETGWKATSSVRAAVAAPLEIVGIGPAVCSGQTLAGSATCTVSVRFAPSSAGAKTAGLGVTGAPGGTQSSALTGTATAPPPAPAATNTPTGQRAAALKKCKKKKANKLPV